MSEHRGIGIKVDLSELGMSEHRGVETLGCRNIEQSPARRPERLHSKLT